MRICTLLMNAEYLMSWEYLVLGKRYHLVVGTLVDRSTEKILWY